MSQQYLDGEAGCWPIEENISRWQELQAVRRGTALDDDDDAAEDDNGAPDGQ